MPLLSTGKSLPTVNLSSPRQNDGRWKGTQSIRTIVAYSVNSGIDVLLVILNLEAELCATNGVPRLR